MSDVPPTESSLDFENLAVNLLLEVENGLVDAHQDSSMDLNRREGAVSRATDTQMNEGSASGDAYGSSECDLEEVKNAASKDVDMDPMDRSAVGDAVDHEELEGTVSKAVVLESSEASASEAVAAQSLLDMSQLRSALPSAAVTNLSYEDMSSNAASVLNEPEGSSANTPTKEEETERLASLIAASTIADLTAQPNAVLRQHYGDRIRYSESIPNTKYAVSWSVKIDDVLIPIGILFYCPYEYPNDTTPINRVARTVKRVHGCHRVAFCNGGSLVMITWSKSIGRAHIVNGSTSRAKLMTWLGHAIQDKGIKMLKALPSQTLETSTVDALGLEPPVRGFDYYNEMDTSQMQVLEYDIGGIDVTYYAPHVLGKILCMEPAPLPEQRLSTAEEVCKASEPFIIRPVNAGLAENYKGDIKCSNDIIPNATAWYERGNNRTKNYIAILKYAAPDTIVVDDWGMLQPDLTFTNGEGIVRSAVPLKSELDKLAEEYDCHCVGLFDYKNLVLVTREADCDEFTQGSIVLLKSGRVRHCLFRWMLLACEIHVQLEME